MKTISIILAAGKGSRMKSSLPKPLHKVTGRALIDSLLESLHNAGISENIFVLGHKNKEMKKHLGNINYVIQEPQLGTGHAVSLVKQKVKDMNSLMLICFADTPLVKPETFQKLLQSINSKNKLAILGFRTSHPNGYGRIITNKNNSVIRIVEQRDANQDDLKVTLCNSGILAGKACDIFDYLEKINIANNGEYYLTDIIKVCSDSGHTVKIILGDHKEFLGVNNRSDLAEVEKIFQQQLRTAALSNGVSMINPSTVYFSFDTKVESDVLIEPNVIFGDNVTVKKNSTIRAFSYLEDCIIGKGCTIGPYARIRPKTILSENVKIGNFVEIKKSEVGENSKVNHLTYIGDTKIGKDSNIGAGTITCNYDGVSKHITNIGNNSFVGSNTSLVAPVSIGDNTTIGAGSTITKDVKSNTLAIERSIQKEIKKRKINFKSDS